MTWFKRIVTAVVVLAVLFVLVGLVLPATFSYETVVTVAASPADIHPHLDDLEAWPAWMPFYEDPDLELTPGDAMRGEGANQSWRDASGVGTILVTASDPAAGLTYDITLIDGKVKGSASLSFADAAGGEERPAAEWTATAVTWTMDGTYGDLATRWMGLLTGGMTRGMLETGLRNLKTLVEKGPAEETVEED